MPYRDLWLKHRPAIKTDLKNQKITIPAFSFNCGPDRASLYFNSDAFNFLYPLLPAGQLVDSLSALTIEAWVKIQTYEPNTERAIFHRERLIGVPQYKLLLYEGRPRLVFNIAGVVYTYSATNRIHINEWDHIAAVFDNANANVKFYIRGELDSTHNHAAGPLTARGGGNPSDFIGIDELVHPFKGYLGNIRIWNVARTADQIYFYKNSPRGIDIDTNLIGYLRFAEGIGDRTREEVKNEDWIFANVPGPVWNTNDAYPIRYGASFVCGRFEVALENKSALRFPVRDIQNPNHALVVRYTDENDVVRRRYLYTATGVDFDNTITEYKGETLSETFYLEIWNKDGAETADLAENLVLYLSITTVPTYANDRIAEVAATVAADTTLAEPFPLTSFPLEFNSQQTY